ncbi:MAG: response regulator transcription factor [Halioglobus sp.]|nr:response regulator transcription factor [Halioglobus sp.]
MNILLVEDDKQVAEFVVAELSAAGHSCVHACDGSAGREAAINHAYDVMVIDRMMPKMNGLELISALRKAGDNTPVLVLSALGDVDDRVQGLHSGADDYLVKPFAMAELLARLDVLKRRSAKLESEAQTRLVVHDLSMDLLRQFVQRGETTINLQPREYKLLEYLMRHAGQVVTRAMLLEHVWGYHFDPQTNVIDVHISRLRQKIDKGFERPLLLTVRGTGYRLGPELDH